MGRMHLQDMLWFHYIESRGYQLVIWGSLWDNLQAGVIGPGYQGEIGLLILHSGGKDQSLEPRRFSG